MARRRDDQRARRIEIGVYVVAGLSYIVTGFIVRSAVLNWIVGPAWFVAWVTLVTPLVLRLAGIEDPDGPGHDLPTAADFPARPPKADAKAGEAS
ncbi:MAG TPA: hypothetical protein VK507_02290 [Iamia sp.]|nr:hypothetical protein [Iamia sp.]